MEDSNSITAKLTQIIGDWPMAFSFIFNLYNSGTGYINGMVAEYQGGL